jgi:hypothetical protein
MEVMKTVLVTKEVQLHPWDGGGHRDKTKPTYSFRLLQTQSDHIDYDVGKEMWVDSLVSQVQKLYPADGTQWGEAHSLVQPSTSGTQMEFEDGVKTCLTLLDRQGTVRLQNYVANFKADKQLSEERTEWSKTEAAAEDQ